MPKVMDDINSDEDEVDISKKKGELKNIRRKNNKKAKDWLVLDEKGEGRMYINHFFNLTPSQCV